MRSLNIVSTPGQFVQQRYISHLLYLYLYNCHACLSSLVLITRVVFTARTHIHTERPQSHICHLSNTYRCEMKYNLNAANNISFYYALLYCSMSAQLQENLQENCTNRVYANNAWMPSRQHDVIGCNNADFFDANMSMILLERFYCHSSG